MDLIERLEQATEGSRELDAEINLEVFTQVALPDPPPYTTSLDAALSLAGERAYSVLLEAMAIAAGFFCTFQDKGDHIKRMLPLFVCRAALRARQSQEAR